MGFGLVLNNWLIFGVELARCKNRLEKSGPLVSSRGPRNTIAVFKSKQPPNAICKNKTTGPMKGRGRRQRRLRARGRGGGVGVGGNKTTTLGNMH
jgi:hypothetical protein